MNIGDVKDKLTVNQSVITDYYEQEYAHAEFKVKGSDVFADDLVKYFGEEIHCCYPGFSVHSLPWLRTGISSNN